MEKYDAAAILARSLVATGDSHPSTRLNGALAIRRGNSISDAYAFLIAADSFLHRSALFQLNVACYLCQLGRIEVAKNRIRRAVSIDPKLKFKALDGFSLATLWESLAGELNEA